jgi:hypothetical protein
MAVNDAVAPIARYDFARGALRGTQLALYRACLVRRAASELETIPLAALAAVRIGFERDRRQIGWGAALVACALLLFGLSGPLGSFGAQAVAELTAAGNQGVGRALISFFRAVEVIAGLLPLAAVAFAVGGAGLAGLGWQGSTILTLSLPGAERAFAARGREPALLDFAQTLSDRLVALERT